MKTELTITKSTNGHFIVEKSESKPTIYESINELILNEFFNEMLLNQLKNNDLSIVKVDIEVE